MTHSELIAAVARAVCAEQCSWCGEPPCHEVDPAGTEHKEWCECQGVAMAAVEAVYAALVGTASKELAALNVDRDRIWNLPNVEHGKAQIPYLYGEDTNAALNHIMTRGTILRDVLAWLEASPLKERG